MAAARTYLSDGHERPGLVGRLYRQVQMPRSERQTSG